VTDTAHFPTGSRRDGPTFAGVAYITPTGPGRCRQFHTFIKPSSPMRPLPPTPSRAAAAQQKQQHQGGKPMSNSISMPSSSISTTTNSSNRSNGKTDSALDTVSARAGNSAKANTVSARQDPDKNAGPNRSPVPRRPWRVRISQLLPTPRWVSHMTSNFLVDADVAVQWGCGRNR
jgi:hypothetical protein